VVRNGISASGIVPNYSIEELCERVPLIYNGEIVGRTSVRRMVFKGQGWGVSLTEAYRPSLRSSLRWRINAL
jgi:hypothetical protein